MSRKEHRLGYPPATVSGQINGQEIKVNDFDIDTAEIVTTTPLPESFDLEAIIYDMDVREYRSLMIRSCHALEVSSDAYEYVYTIQFGVFHGEERCQYIDLVERYYDFMKKYKESGSVLQTIKDGFIQNYTPYPYASDADYHSLSSFKVWKNEIMQNTEFNKKVDDLKFEFCICLDQLTLIESALEQGISKTLKTMQYADHPILSRPVKRIYIGSEFCPRILSKYEEVKKLLQYAFDDGYAVTISTSFISEYDLPDVMELLNQLDQYLSISKNKIEVVFNDWGMLNLINRSRNMTPVLGRLLNRRKKDTRSEWWWGYQENQEQLRENNLNTPHFQAFLKQNNVERYEFELGLQVDKIPVGKHSLHFPFYQISTGAFCLLYAYCRLERPDYVQSCPGYCKEFYYKYPKHLTMVGKGNSIFGYSQDILTSSEKLSAYLMQGIDRLVYTPL